MPGGALAPFLTRGGGARRILKYAGCSEETFILALIYMDQARARPALPRTPALRSCDPTPLPAAAPSLAAPPPRPAAPPAADMPARDFGRSFSLTRSL